MERMTKRENGHVHYPRCFEEPCGGMGCRTEDCGFKVEICERLAAYEDTGLEPEEVNDAVVGSKLLAKSQLVSAFGVAAERLRELAEADKDERVVVLPVKPVLTPIISSMLYIIKDGDIYEDALYEAVVGMSESGKTNVVYTTLSDQMIFEQADIGKTVSLTREEAEKALEAMKDD